MTVKIEDFKENEILKDLTQEQLSLIVDLSNNIFKQAFDDHVGGTAKRIEEDVKNLFGIEKNQGERYHDYLKRAATDLITKYEGLDVDYKDLEHRHKELSKGKTTVSSELEQQLKDSKNTIDQLRADLEEANGKADTVKNQYEKIMLDQRVQSELRSALTGLKPKPGMEKYADKVLETEIKSIMSELTYEVSKLDDGSEVIMYRDSEGRLLQNPQNGRNPFTSAELIQSRVGDLYITEPVKGGGTQPRSANGGELSITFDPSTMDKQELLSAVRQQVKSEGLKAGTQEYLARESQLYGEGVKMMQGRAEATV